MKNFEMKTNSELDDNQIMFLYRQYCKKEIQKGREPVSYRQFVTGRY